MENTIEGEKSVQYTYQEFIDQGSSLPPLVGTDSLENTLRKDYEEAKAIRGQAK